MIRIISIIVLVFLFVSGCRVSRMTITDEYVEIIKPGQRFGLVEIEALSFDSLFGYPTEERSIRSMTLVNRVTGKQIAHNARAKVFFDKKNVRYQWSIRANIFLADRELRDTIVIKPETWYRLSRERGAYHTIYFYWNGPVGDFKTIVKPDPGAW